jgi:metal-dependent hydrolase (beta-lactamase superfamily II)
MTGIMKLGLDPAKIWYIIPTHEHGDHYDGANYLKVRCLQLPRYDIECAYANLARKGQKIEQ